MTAPSGRPVAWFHCFAGVAGDMVLGSLVDAGADIDAIKAILAALELPGWALRTDVVYRCGIAATRVVVDVVADDVTVRSAGELLARVGRADLPDVVRRRSLQVLRALAEAESQVHRVPADQVHLHELGGHDTLVDVVGSAAGLYLLGIEEIVVSPVTVGMGTIETAHGTMPNPSPAVVTLLRGAPTKGRDTPVELTTPTGAALMATWADGFGPMPAMTVIGSGFGAGTSEPVDLPNCVQVVIGNRLPATVFSETPASEMAGPKMGGFGVPGSSAPGFATPGSEADDPGEALELVETTVDDVTGEILADTLAALLEAGALDAWLAPVVMKQGRPGTVVSALARPHQVSRLGQVLRSQTGTLGYRSTAVCRWASPRTVDEVVVFGHTVRVKVGPDRAKAEHGDAARVAGILRMPVRQVALAAEAAWASGHLDAHRPPDLPAYPVNGPQGPPGADQ
jgi:uncharacterized protein (TIGR00299 family) protein